MVHDVPLLTDLLFLLLVSVPTAFICHRLRIPMIVGFMIVGMIVGPHGLGMVRDPDAVEVLADIGVALLLFVIGLEFSLRRLLHMRRLLFLGGGLQVTVTVAVVTLAVAGLGRSLSHAVFAGFLLALSSTALVLRSYADRADLDAPHGRVSMAILLFQDLCIVPMMILAPLLAGQGGAAPLQIAAALGKAGLAIIAIVAAARFVVPLFMRQVVRLRSPEVFVLSAVLVIFGTSWLTAQLGLSVAIGAFIAGLVLSESEYSHQIVADVLPFRDVFIGLFFISIGMLLSWAVVRDRLGLVFGGVALVMVVKALLTGGIVRALAYPWRVAILAGVGLAQVGEFSFVLAREGLGLGLLTNLDYQTFLAVSILSMLVTPFLISLAPRVAYARQGREAMLADRGEAPPPERTDHVLVVGYGLNGRNLSRVLRNVGIPHVVLELNADLAREAAGRGESVIYGDATRREVLLSAGITGARALVLAISDPIASRHTVWLARRLNPRVHIIVRTRYMRELEDLLALGADEVIPEEFETSIQIFGSVLQKYEVKPEDIDREVEAVRREGYQVLRNIPATEGDSRPHASG
ncbi:MAG: cation:proton antiporter [Gemmatimonadales bacterium]